jgi:hypothetical protein
LSHKKNGKEDGREAKSSVAPLVLISIVPVGGGCSSGLRVRKRRKQRGDRSCHSIHSSQTPLVSLHPYYFYFFVP